MLVESSGSKSIHLRARACAGHEGKIVLLLSQCGEAQNVYFRAALSRVTHQAFGALQAAYVCVFVLGYVFVCGSADYLSPSLSVSQSDTRACPEGAGL